MSKIYAVLAIIIVAVVSGAMSIFVSNAIQLRQSLEGDVVTTSIIDIADIDIADNPQINYDYSEWQEAIGERDNTIKLLNQDVIEFHEVNKKWVESEKQWISEKATLELEITTWQEGSTNLLKIFQTVILDNIAKQLVDLSYDKSAYNVLLPIAHEPLAQELLLKQLTANAISACKGLEGLKNQGIITSTPQYGEKCLFVKDLFENLEK